MSKLKRWVAYADAVYERVRKSLGDALLLLLRLYWGYQFAVTGWGKLNNLERVASWFGSMGIPFPELNAALVGGFELVGGIVLIAGFGRGYFSIPLVGIMAVAYLTDDYEALAGIFSDPDAFVNALPFLYMLVNLLVIAFGPGRISVDRLITRVRGGDAGGFHEGKSVTA